MPITAHLPPITGDTTNCASKAEYIISRFWAEQKKWPEDERADHYEASMRDAYRSVMEQFCNDDNLLWLKSVEEFWRKPVHVQTLEVQLGLARAELARRTEFLAWLTSHVQSTKFQGEGNNFINTSDIIHALREHGVYGG